MRKLFKWASLAVLFFLFSCAKAEYTGGVFDFSKPGVYGYITPIEIGEAPGTKATVDARTLKYHFEVGDRINIWSATGTTLLYNVEEVNENGRATFGGGGFTLANGETYYSSHPLIRSTADDYKSLTTSYEGQVQKANDDANHIADYTYTYSSAVCENGNTSFQYHHLCSFFMFYVTLPEAMTLKELSITAVGGNDGFFALDGTADVTDGSFTPGRTSNTMTLGLNNIQVDDKLLLAYLSVAPVPAGEYVIRVIDSEDNVYTSPKIAKDAFTPGKGDWFVTEVFPGENSPVAQIGSEVYYSLVDAVAAVTTNEETTITMIDDDIVDVSGYAITIANGKNIILDLNGKTVTGVCSDASTSALIRNLGTFTISDSSTGGKLIGGADNTWTWDGSDDYTGSYASNLIRNEGTLVVNGGTLYNASTGSAAYAIDNYSAGKVTINDGTIDVKKASAIRLFYNNGGEVTVNGGTVGHYNSDEDCSYMGIQVMSGSNAVVNVSGGTIAGDYALYSNATGTSAVTISGGSFDGYVCFGSAGPDNISISGGMFNAWVGSYGSQSGYITGGIFAGDPSSDVAEDYIVTANTDPETKDDYPYTVVEDTNEYVAKIGSTKYLTLEAAFAAAEDGETITLLEDCAGNGIIAPQGKFGTEGLTVDFNGKTYTVDGNLVGSTGTESQAFQLLKDNKITFTGGTVYSEKALFLVQNYSNLTLEGMTLTLNNANYAYGYTLSNNNGTVVIDNSTINANPAGAFAFDVCRNASYPSVDVTVKGASVINGDVEISASSGDAKDGFRLMLEDGSINGNLVVDASAATAMAATPAKALIMENDTFGQAAPAGFKWESNGDGTSTLVACNYVAKIGNVEYETLEAAFAAAQDGETITLLANSAGNGIIAPQGKFGTNGLTVDFNGNTYTVDGATVGSTGTETQAFQLLKDNKITFKNGTIGSAKAKMLVQNYSDLTLEGMTLTLNNPNYTSAYTLSNNNGNVVIKDTEINANPAGGFAFDVCRYASYPSVDVTVKGSSVINGDVEVSASGSDPKDGFGLTVEAGTFNGNLVIDGTAATAMANTPEKAVITKDNNVSLAAPSGFKWVDNGDGTSTLKAVVNVAKIGSVEYETLEAAFAAAQDGETITLLANSAGNGIIAPQGKFSTSGLTLDFNGHTYEFSGRGVGSNGTENNGFQLLMGNTITFKNGTLTATSEDAGFLIQNYSNLTLQNMTVDGSNIWGGYVISNNNGNVLIDGSTITAPSGDFAFDVCRYASYPSVYVTVTGNSAINGKIEVSASGGNASNGFGLTLNAGTFNGDLVIDGSAATAMANTPDKAVVTKDNNVSLDAPEGFKWVDNGDGTSTLKAVVNVAQIGTTKYETLEEAFAAAQDGQTITLLADCAGNGIQAPQGKFANGVTVDFNGFTYTMDGAMVGSSGTQTQAFQLLMDNKITFKNGTITSAKAKIMVQNYSDLTLDNMTLTLNNPSYTSAYTLSNNNGNVVIKDTEINANPAGGFAFDVCRYATYPSVNVTVKGSSAINGSIEVSASGSDPLDGFSLTLEAGTLSGNIVLDQTAKNAIASNPQKAVIKKSNSLTAIAAPADYKWVDNGDGTSTLAPTYVTQIGGTKYETLEAAFAAATDGATITLLADCAGNGIFASPGRFTTDGLTVDFNSYTYTVDGETVGSSGYETQGFHLEQNNKITFKNGEITSSKAKMLIQNYSDLTLEGMTITLNNPNYTSAYTLSNNNGNVVIDATRIEANPAGGFAFDVCRYSSYPSVNVTVKSGSIITGNVEVSASGSDAKDGFSLLLETAISGNIVIDNSAAQAMAATPDKATVRKLNAVSQNAPTGFVWVNNGDGTDKLVAE